MGRVLSICMIVILASVLFIPHALAAKSQTFTIGATIPAIPGVNTPLLTEEIIQTDYWKDSDLVMIEERTKEGSTETILKTFVAL